MKKETIVYRGKTKKGKDIIVRYPTIEDLPELLRYINELSREQTFIRFQGELLTEEEEKKYLADFIKKIQKGEGVKLLAFHKNQLVGVSDIYLEDKVSQHVGVFGITVAKDYRGEGVGKLLMTLVEQEAKKNMTKLKIIQLGVFGNNPTACFMYERFGFKKYGKLPKGVKHRNEFVDHIYMYKEI